MNFNCFAIISVVDRLNQLVLCYRLRWVFGSDVLYAKYFSNSLSSHSMMLQNYHWHRKPSLWISHDKCLLLASINKGRPASILLAASRKCHQRKDEWKVNAWLTPAPSNFADLPSQISIKSKSSTDQSSRRRIFSAPHLMSSFSTQSINF